MRGQDIAMIFQDPMTALNPVFTVGDQIVEVIRLHSSVTKQGAWERAVDLLNLVGVPDPKARCDPVSARVLRRNAPAGHDRHGHRQRSEAA